MAETSVACEVAGRVIRVETAVGQRVEAGDPILFVEAMKMEIPVDAPVSGTIKTLLFAPDDTVAEAAIVAIIET
jgi:biotin carboxyl carrier protein